MDLGQQQLAHLVARRLIKPVKEPAAGGRLAQTLIDLEAHAGEELLDLGDRLQAVTLPATEAEGAGGLDRPILYALKRWRCRRRALDQASVIIRQRLPQCLQT